MLPAVESTALVGSRRVYSSPLRERQAEQTREIILQALAEQLAEGGLADFNIPAVARRADVSVRTIYRYFPTRDALLAAVGDWIELRLIGVALPVTADEIADSAEQAFASFEEHAQLMLAQIESELGRAVRGPGRKRRIEAYSSALRDTTAHLDPAAARAATAIVSYLAGSLAWKTLREEFEISGRESGVAVAWAIRTLIADLRLRETRAVKRERKAP